VVTKKPAKWMFPRQPGQLCFGECGGVLFNKNLPAYRSVAIEEYLFASWPERLRIDWYKDLGVMLTAETSKGRDLVDATLFKREAAMVLLYITNITGHSIDVTASRDR
jgi:hypothetical protein